MTVIIGMDPPKRSATIEVVDERAHVLAVGRFGTDKCGYGSLHLENGGHARTGVLRPNCRWGVSWSLAADNITKTRTEPN